MAFSVATEPGPGDNPFVLKDHDTVDAPLTAVCTKHMMRPIMPKLAKKDAEKKP